MSEPSATYATPGGTAAAGSTPRPRIVFCAKSRWDPPIRREHGIAVTAASLGYGVDFIEQPLDVRDLARPGRTARPAPSRVVSDGVRVRSRFTPVPGHRAALAGRVDALGLRRVLGRVVAAGPTPAAVVVIAPWEWPATSSLPAGVRRVVDMTDDWTTLMPQHRDRILRAYRRISAEADAIVAVAPSLAELFDREVVVVPNAVAPELLATAAVPAPGGRRMTYVGTLSERFDCALMAEVMRRLPDWSLDLYGPCFYAGMGGEPGPELRSLLAAYEGRVSWHGMVSRADMADVLDRSDVLVLPNDPAISLGQDSMKLYDYAARARPIVATPIRVPADGPQVLALAADPADFAAAVTRLDGADAAPNRRWAEGNGWPARLPLWMSAVTGVAS